MKPYYHDEKAGITIYHGDCLEIAPLLDFVVVVSDPPYGISHKKGCGGGIVTTDSKSISSTKKRFAETIHGDDKEFDPSPWLGFTCAFTGAQHFYHKLPQSVILDFFRECRYPS